MLRPIHQLKHKPISTAAKPTHRMMVLVRRCDAESAAEAELRRSCAAAMILSASGSIRSLDVSILTTQGRTLEDASAHFAKVSA